MDNSTFQVESIAHFNMATNLDDANRLWEIALNTIFKDNPSDSKIAVLVSETDACGTYSHIDIYVYDSYTNALNQINELEYKSNTSVNVIEMNVKGYSDIFYKCFDGVCYSRLAQVSFHHWDKFFVRKLWDLESDIYSAKYIQYKEEC